MPAYEESPFPSGGGPHTGNLADVLWMFVFGCTMLLGLGWLFSLRFHALPLFMMVIYVWSRRHPEEQTSFYMFTFKAAYLPWVMLASAFVMGDDITRDLLGIVTGHVYYFLQEVLPHTESPFKGVHLLRTPDALYRVMQLPPTNAAAAYVAMRGGVPRPPPQPRVWGPGRVLGRED